MTQPNRKNDVLEKIIDDLFKAAGIKVPFKTWTEFVRADK